MDDWKRLSLTSSMVQDRKIVPTMVMAIDHTVERYILMGSKSIGLYDTENDKIVHHMNASKAGVSDVEWFPRDNGIFVTSSYDGLVEVCDTTSMQVACTFNMKCAVNKVGMSKAMDGKMELIAVGMQSAELRLCDMALGSSVHTLLGHTEAIYGVDWCPGNGYELCSASKDGTIRIWDIRKSGRKACVMVLDKSGNAKSGNKRKLNEVGGVSHRKGVAVARYTPGGMHIVSAGRVDGTVRTWKARTGEHEFINYTGLARSKYGKGCLKLVQPDRDASAMFVYPYRSSRYLGLYPMHCEDGLPLVTLDAMCDEILCCVVRRKAKEVYMAGCSGVISVARCAELVLPNSDEEVPNAAPEEESDNWSDDEDTNLVQPYVPPGLQ